MSPSVWFVVRRLLVAVALLFALATVTFWVDQAIYYDPGRYLLGDLQHPTNEQIREATAALGADGSALEQYGDFLVGLLHGDLGISWATARFDRAQGVVGQAVSSLVLNAVGVTGSLVLGGMLLLLLAVVPGGTLLAARADSWVDRTALLLALAAISTHPLVLGNVLQVAFGERLGLLPEQGYCPLFGTGVADPVFDPATQQQACGGLADWATHMILPWISFTALLLALHLRQMRASALTVLAEPYVTVARAKGVPDRQVLRRHVVPNALPPVVTTIATDIGAMLGVALYVEVVFRLPGLGYIFMRAVQGTVGFDRPVIIAVVLVVGAAVIVGNLAADLIVARLDPRVRLGGRGRSLLGSAE
jgi:peptide/nickel transport system permease protein